MLAFAPALEPMRLVRLANYSGAAGGGVWPATPDLTWLFVLGSCSPPTRSRASTPRRTRPRRRWGRPRPSRAVWSARSRSRAWPAGSMLSAVVLAVPDLDEAAARGELCVRLDHEDRSPSGLALAFNVGIALAQYGCGLAAMTSASRMAFAFARDGGLPGSRAWRWVCPTPEDPGRRRLGGGRAGGALHAQHPGLCHDHRRLHDLPLPLVHAPHGPRRLGLRAELDDDGAVGPGPLVSPPGVRQRGRLRAARSPSACSPPTTGPPPSWPAPWSCWPPPGSAPSATASRGRPRRERTAFPPEF